MSAKASSILLAYQEESEEGKIAKPDTTMWEEIFVTSDNVLQFQKVAI